MSECERKNQAEQPDDQVTNLDDVKTCNILQHDMMKRLIAKNNYTFMVSGRPRTGKSTALNNLLGLTLEAKISPNSVTKSVIVKQTTPSQSGIRGCGIDTPGLLAADRDDKEDKCDLKDMRKKIGSEADNFTLLFCVSMMNNVEADLLAIMKKLTEEFGAGIWTRCILVLTYCDTLRKEHFESKDMDEAYKKFLHKYAKTFGKTLSKCISDAPAVKVILDCEVVGPTDNNKMTELEVPSDVIVAVPAAKTKEDGRKHNILPGFNIGGNIGWTEYALFEIMMRSGRFTPPEIKEIKEKYNLSTLAADTAIGLVAAAGGGAVVGGTGAGIGAGIGALVGVAGGPPGVALGAIIGAGVGGGLGAITGLGTYIWHRRK